MEYTFTLKYQLTEDGDQDALVEALGEAGCDDALVGIGLPGRVALEFTREAPSAAEALLSALADAKAAMPEARLTEAAPDFVGLTDVADTVGVSRQNMRKLMLSHGPAFPAPIHDGSTSLWHLADVLAWLQERGNYLLDESVVEVARVTRQVNLARENRQAARGLQRDLKDLVG